MSRSPLFSASVPSTSVRWRVGTQRVSKALEGLQIAPRFRVMLPRREGSGNGGVRPPKPTPHGGVARPGSAAETEGK